VAASSENRWSLPAAPRTLRNRPTPRGQPAPAPGRRAPQHAAAQCCLDRRAGPPLSSSPVHSDAPRRPFRACQDKRKGRCLLQDVLTLASHTTADKDEPSIHPTHHHDQLTLTRSSSPSLAVNTYRASSCTIRKSSLARGCKPPLRCRKLQLFKSPTSVMVVLPGLASSRELLQLHWAWRPPTIHLAGRTQEMTSLADALPIAFLLGVVVVTWWREVLRFAAVVVVMLLIIAVMVLLGTVGGP